MSTICNHRTFLITFALVFNYNLLAQSSLNIGVDLSAGLKGFPPHGKFGKGLSVEYEKSVFANGSLRLYVGYDRFKQRFPNIDPRRVADSIVRFGIDGYNFAVLPIRIGYQHTLFKNGPFAYAEAGISRILTNTIFPSPSKNISSYSVGTGYRLNLKSHGYLQFSSYYTHNRITYMRVRNYISFRAAYGLAFSSTKKDN